MTENELSPHMTQGRILDVLHVEGMGRFDVACPIPGIDKLLNFEIKVGGGFLILDPYGNEHLPEEVEARLMPNSPTLAIGLVSGQCYIAQFFQTEEQLVLALIKMEGRVVPKKYRKRLPELLSHKRPFTFMLPNRVLVDLLDQEIGYRDLCDEMVVELDFRPRLLQIGHECHREVTLWV